MEINKLREFLIEAKKQTYANENIKKVSSSRLGSSDYDYQNNGFVYHDTYFDGTRFMGEEVVYCGKDIPIWGMNYYGVTLDESLSEEAIDMALRPALMMVGEDDLVIPVRGPREYKNGEYIYTFQVTGDLEYFDGVEAINKGSKKIYELKCHGGLIKK